MDQYYNRYNRAAGWKAVRFLDGRGLQSAELNEVQSLLADELHQLGRTIYSNGQVVRGCELILPGDGTAVIGPGQIYYDGFFQDFAGGEVAITGADEEIVGLHISEREVSETDDPSLLDPAQGWPNHGQKGAHRLVYGIEVRKDDAEALPLYALQDGALSADHRPQPDASDLVAQLARRTYDESGDYIVRGLRVWVEARDAETLDESIIKTQEVDWFFRGQFGWWANWTETERTLTNSTVLATSRARTVRMDGYGLQPYADNLRLFFDGTPLGMTPIAGTVAGGEEGTVRASPYGGFSATFQVPAGVPSGTHSVVVENATNSAATQYLIDGRQLTWREHTTIHRVIPRAQTDPVAQTFTVPTDTMIGAVDLYFAQRGSSLPVLVSIRNVVAGVPGSRILAETSLIPDQVQVSWNGVAPTRAEFRVPALCEAGEEYAIVVATESANYQLHFAELGRRDQHTGQMVVANPYTGVMLSSANASTWTAHQDADLKFRLVRARFVAARMLDFGARDVDGSVVTLFGSAIEPPGCSVTWEIELDGSGSWMAVPTGEIIDLGRQVSRIAVRAWLRGSFYLSPAVLRDSVGLVVVKWNDTGAYVSRNTVLSAFQELRVFADTATSSGTAVGVDFSTDGGASWSAMGAPVGQRAVNADYTENEYRVTGLADPTQLRLRVNLDASADRVRVPRVRRLRAIAT